MEYGVYLESSSVASLKPRVLDFLTKLVEKAKDVKDFAISFKKKEIADYTENDVRTVTRYLNELENRNIITMKGVRGRTGGTVVMFNSDVIHFETSDRALVNSDTPVSIDDIVEKKIPKKQKKEPTRNRRTKKQMIEAQVLKNNKQTEIDKLNEELLELGTPNWGWFQKTEDPIGNYRTYLISRMYNRYAALFVEDNNYWGLNGKLPEVKAYYDVLPKDFYGSSRWAQFDKFRNFCEENGIDPAVYLSAQFNRTVFDAANKNKKSGYLPFTNALMSESSLEVYRQYCQFKMTYDGHFKSTKEVRADHMDFVMIALREAYNTAEECKGIKERFFGSIDDFINEDGSTEEEVMLKDFYIETVGNLKQSNVSDKTKETIDNFLLTQLLMNSGGQRRLPVSFILGSEIMEAAVAAVKRDFGKNADNVLAKVFGIMTNPYEPNKDRQLALGYDYLRHYKMLDETPQVFRLIMQRQGLALSIADINEAIREYGKHNLPVDDYNFIQTDKILERKAYIQAKAEEKFTDADMVNITQTTDIILIQGNKSTGDGVAQVDSILPDFNI